MSLVLAVLNSHKIFENGSPRPTLDEKTIVFDLCINSHKIQKGSSGARPKAASLMGAWTGTAQAFITPTHWVQRQALGKIGAWSENAIN